MASFMAAEFGRLLRKERVFRDRTSQLDSLSDDELVSRYRLPRHCIFSLLEKVRPYIEHPTGRSHAISPETQLLLTLRYLSKGGFLMEMGDLHGVHESSVSRSFHRKINALVETLDNVNFLPEKSRLRMQEFYNIAEFPRVIGAIDGTLIPIKKPSLDEEAAYVCRKGFHAINVQAVCDANLRFINVVVKWPGSCHDSLIFTNSNLGQFLERNPQNRWLLGDSGYPCRPWILTPVLDPQTRPEQKYNGSHCKTRNTIERAFGVLKSRFRCLQKSTSCLQFSPEKCSAIIMAAFKLHTLCVDLRVPDPPLLEEGEHMEMEIYHNDVEDGVQIRKEIIAKKFS